MWIRDVIKKICMLGDPAVGKTSLVHRFVFNIFDDSYLATIGTKIMKKVMELQYPDVGIEVKLTLIIWDITGHKRHKAIHPTYYEGAEGAFVVCDATREDTMKNVDIWTESLFSVVDKVPVVYLVNKIDLVEDKTFPIVSDIAKKWDVNVVHTSAKTSENVEKAFTLLGDLMVRDVAYG